MNKDVNEGFVNLSHSIYGVALKPYSAAHLFALESGQWTGFGTPLGAANFIDICSRNIDRNSCLPKGYPDAGMSLKCALLLALFISFPKYYEKAVLKCSLYLKDHNAWPRVAKIRKEDAGLSIVPPFEGSAILQVVVAGMRLGLSRFEAWSIPFGSLQSYAFHRAVLDGEPIQIQDVAEDLKTAAFFKAQKQNV